MPPDTTMTDTQDLRDVDAACVEPFAGAADT